MKRLPSSGRFKVMKFSADDAQAYMEASALLKAVQKSLDDYFEIGRFACKKKLANGAVLKVELRMPPLPMTKKKPRRVRR